MKDWLEQKGIVCVCFVLLIFLACTLLWSLCLGSVSIPVTQIYETIINQIVSITPIDAVDKGPVHDIVWQLRMPRLLLAVVIGAGLSVSGVIMQAIVKNPLADPYILGISSGASLGATAAILLGIGIWLGPDFVGVAAFLGALGISFLVLFVSNIGGSSNATKLLLAGMALSSVCGAFSSFIVYFSPNKEGLQNVVFWLMGSLAGAQWGIIEVIAIIVISAIIFFVTQSRILNLMLLGDDVSITLGRDLHGYRQVYLMVSSLIVGVSVYAAGMIGFVGLIIPHIVRSFVGTDHKKMVPICALVGANFLVIADALCRILIPKTELPIGILISLVGAPLFVYLMIKRTYNFGGGN